MELKSAINIILKDLEDARDLIDDLRNYPGVPLIQIELARSKCRSAADVIKLLSSLLEEMMEASVVIRQPETASETDTGSLDQKQISTPGSANFYQQPEVSGENEVKKEITPDVTTAETKTTETEASTPEANTIKARATDASTTDASTSETNATDARATDASTTDASTSETNATDARATETNATDARATETSTSETSAEITPSIEPDKQAPSKPESEKHRNVIDEIIGAYPDGHDDHDEEREQLKSKEPPKIVADRFSHLSERINEQIRDSRMGDQEMSRVKKKITDITKEIGINDRFFLIRELFGGSQEKYVSALNELNSVTSNEEAKRVIERYRAPSGDREAGKMLSELVRIKLSSSNG